MKTIVWDIDDVLIPSTQIWLNEWFKNPHGIKYQDLHQNPPHEILQISKDEYLKSLDEFRVSPLFEKTSPTKEVYTWFLKNGHHFNHIALTARPIKNASYASKWLFDHFGNWIRQFVFVPSKRDTDPLFNYFLNKKEALLSFNNVTYFIDDTPININNAKEIGINAIEFPRPWNNQKLSVNEILDLLK